MWLIEDPRVDPSTQDNGAIRYASERCHMDIINIRAKSRYFCLNPFGLNSGKKYRQKAVGHVSTYYSLADVHSRKS